MLKKKYKKEPFYRTQLVKDTVDSEYINIVLDKYQTLLDNIIDEKFEPNYKACKYQYGKPCIFYGLCHHQNEEGLKKR